MQGLFRAMIQLNYSGEYGLEFSRIFEDINTIRTVSALMYTPEHFVLVLEVDWKNEAKPEVLVNQVFVENAKEVYSLRKTSTYVVVGEYPDIVGQLITHVIDELECFFDFPIGIELGKIHLPVVGTKQSIRKRTEFLEEHEFRYELSAMGKFYLPGRR